MKVIIIMPLEASKARNYMINKTDLWLEDLNQLWKKYQSNHPEIPLNLEFEYRLGNDLHTIYLNAYFYFSKQDIANLKSEIHSLIEKKEIAGIIIDPILTLNEEKKDMNKYKYMNSYIIPGNTLEELFDEFSDSLPIFFYAMGSVSSFFRSPLYDKMRKAHQKRGYDHPYILSHFVPSIYEPMFACLVDSSLKMQEDSKGSMKSKHFEK